MRSLVLTASCATDELLDTPRVLNSLGSKKIHVSISTSYLFLRTTLDNRWPIDGSSVAIPGHA
jgi:hypothetical protein